MTVSSNHVSLCRGLAVILWKISSYKGRISSGGSSPQHLGTRPMASAVVQAYNGGLEAEPPAVFRGSSPSSGETGGEAP